MKLIPFLRICCASLYTVAIYVISHPSIAFGYLATLAAQSLFIFYTLHLFWTRLVAGWLQHCPFAIIVSPILVCNILLAPFPSIPHFSPTLPVSATVEYHRSTHAEEPFLNIRSVGFLHFCLENSCSVLF